MVRKLVILSLAVGLAITAALMTACSDDKQQIVSSGTPNANEYRVLDGVDSVSNTFTEFTADSSAYPDGDSTEVNGGLSTGTDDDDDSGGGWSWKDKTNLNDDK